MAMNADNTPDSDGDDLPAATLQPVALPVLKDDVLINMARDQEDALARLDADTTRRLFPWVADFDPYE